MAIVTASDGRAETPAQAVRAAGAGTGTTGADGAGPADAQAPEANAADPADGERKGEPSGEVVELCRLLLAASGAHGVPADFFIRLIWKESRFNPNAVSPVGAQGIAQFMPGTARIRGLKNPFDREEALFASASFLADLQTDFGSWGLAAAGYNGGPNRVPPFVAGAAGLPAETRDYVFSITGRPAEYWARKAREAAGAGDRAGDREAGAPDGDAAADAPGGRVPARRLAMEVLADRLSEAWVADGAAAGAAAPGTGMDRPGGPGAGHGGALGGAPGVTPASLTVEGDVASGDLIAAAARVGVPLPRPDYEPGAVDCPDLVSRLGRARAVPAPAGGGVGWTPWGAQVAGHPKRGIALRQYDRIRAQLPADLVARGPTIVVRRFAARGRMPVHAVMFAAGGQSEAEALCRRIAAARAPCVVVRNR